MEQPLVSIIIVSYNAEKFIKKTLESCLAQTYSPLEILILDNFSKDNTIEIIEYFKDSRIKLFKGKSNVGPYAGLNFLIDRAQGKYIAVQDHDDIWFPEKIKKQIEFLEKNPSYIACGTNTFYYFEKIDRFTLTHNTPETNFVDHTSLVFRNLGVRYDTKYVLSDEHFEKIVLASHGKTACLPQSLTLHRIRKDGQNLSSYRFLLNWKNIKEYFAINRLSLRSVFYILTEYLKIFLPNGILWFKRRVLAQGFDLKQFKTKYPEVSSFF